MTSKLQILANQQNAQHSSGPRTLNGKKVAARNSTKHGLTSSGPWDHDPAFLNLFEELQTELKPKGPLDLILVRNIAVATHRQNLVWLTEKRIFGWAFLQNKNNCPGLAFINDAAGDQVFEKISRYGTSVERSLYRALSAWRNHRKDH